MTSFAFQFVGVSLARPVNSRFWRLSWIQFRAYFRWSFFEYYCNSFFENATSTRRWKFSANRLLWSRQVHHFPWYHFWSQRRIRVHAWESYRGQNHPLRHGDWRKFKSPTLQNSRVPTAMLEFVKCYLTIFQHRQNCFQHNIESKYCEKIETWTFALFLKLR